MNIKDRACAAISLKHLRRRFPDISARGKKPFVDEWYRQDADELEQATIYWESTKEQSAFYFRLPQLVGNAQDIAQLLHGRRVDDTENGCVYEVVEAKPSPDRNRVYARIRVHSREYRPPNAEHPTSFKRLRNLSYRQRRTTHLILHIDDRIAEAKTASATKAIAAAKTATRLTTGTEGTFEQIEFDYAIQTQIDRDVRFQQALLANVNVAGTTEILLKGTDVARTVEYLRVRGVDIGDQVKYQKSTCENRPFKFFQNGKVKANFNIPDIFDELRQFMVEG